MGIFLRCNLNSGNRNSGNQNRFPSPMGIFLRCNRQWGWLTINEIRVSIPHGDFPAL